MIITLKSCDSALATSTSCLSATLRYSTRRSGLISRPSCRSRSAAWRLISGQSMSPPSRRGSRPRWMLDAIDSCGMRLNSWLMTLMPACCDCSGSLNSTTRPRTSMVPEVGGCWPPSTLISVDFPAPFSPTRAWTSPGRSSRSTPSSASTPGNRLEMSWAVRMGCDTGPFVRSRCEDGWIGVPPPAMTAPCGAGGADRLLAGSRQGPREPAQVPPGYSAAMYMSTFSTVTTSTGKNSERVSGSS